MTTKIKSGVIAAGAIDANALSDNSITIAHLNCSDGTNGQVLSTDGSGTLSFTDMTGGVDGIVSSADATAITIDSSENVGIGTSSPASLLDVRGGNIYVDGGGSGGASQVILTTSASSGSNFGQISNTGTRWSLGYGAAIGTVGTEALTWNSSGNVGIGTTSPAAKLHVEGATSGVNLLIDDSTGWGVYVSTQNTLNFNYGKNSAVTGYINFAGYQNGYTQFRNLDISNGKQGSIAFFDGVNSRVGIGTTSPSSILHIEGDTNSYTSAPILYFGSTSVANAAVRDWAIGPADSTYGDFHIYQGASTGASPLSTSNAKLTINASGNIGIGTIIPADKLHVKKSSTAVGEAILTVEGGSGGYGTGISFQSTLTGGSLEEMAKIVADGEAAWNTTASTQDAGLRFFTTGDGTSAERMRITSGGLITAGTSSSDTGNNIRNWTTYGYIELSGDLPGYSAAQYPTLRATGSYLYFAVNGAYSAYLNSSGTLTPSDERLKENVTSLTNSLSKVQQLRGVNFTWINQDRGTGNNIGFIAQEVEEVFPEVVGDGGLPNDENNEAPMKAVNYEKLVPVLVESIKELKTELDAAKARIETLENA